MEKEISEFDYWFVSFLFAAIIFAVAHLLVSLDKIRKQGNDEHKDTN